MSAFAKGHCDKLELTVFSCELQSTKKNPRREYLSYCADKNFTFLQLRLGETGKPHVVLPKKLAGSLSKFAFGTHSRAGGHSNALALADSTVMPLKEWTLDAGFETGQNGSDDSETQDYSLDITNIESETSQELVCDGTVEDHLDLVANRVKRLDYFHISEGILPRKSTQIDEVAAAKALLKELQDEKIQLKKFAGVFFSLNENLFQHGLVVDIDGDGVDDRLFFVQNVDVKKVQKNVKNIRVVSVESATDLSQGLLVVLNPQKPTPEMIYFTGLSQFKLKNFQADKFATLRLSEIDASYQCKGDGIVADTPAGDYIICKTSAKQPLDYQWKGVLSSP